MVKKLSISNDILKKESWDREIQKARLIYLSEIMKVDPYLAEIGNVILYDITKTVQCDKDNCLSKLSREHIPLGRITHELSHGHTLWLDRVKQLKQIKSIYEQIEDSIKQFEKLIDRFNDVFIRSNSYIKSAL